MIRIYEYSQVDPAEIFQRDTWRLYRLSCVL